MQHQQQRDGNQENFNKILGLTDSVIFKGGIFSGEVALGKTIISWRLGLLTCFYKVLIDFTFNLKWVLKSEEILESPR